VCLPGLHVRQERNQGAEVIALGEALALHQPALLENTSAMEKAVGRDEVDPRVSAAELA
jgi:hypothetical protein